MNEGERIRFLRKEKLKMTMEKFGEALGVTKAAISRIESGAVALTDQNRISICRIYNVREEWLRYGEGEPFAEVSRDKQIEKMVNEIMLDKPDSFKRRYITALAALDEDGWAALERFVDSIAEANKEKPQPVAEHNDIDTLPPDEQELLRQYREKKSREGESSASSAG